MGMKRWQFLGVAMAIVSQVLSACGGGTPTPVAGVPTNVAAKKSDLLVVVTSTGSVSLPNQINLTFGSAGTVTDIYVTEGERVTVGQKLAQLDPSSLRLALAQAKTNVSVAQQDLDNLNDPSNRAAAVSAAAQTAAKASSDLSNAQQGLTDAQKPYVGGDIKTSENAYLAAQQALQTAQDSLAALTKDHDLALATAQQAYNADIVAVTTAQQVYDYALYPEKDPAIVALQASLESAKNSLDAATRALGTTKIQNDMDWQAAQEAVDAAYRSAKGSYLITDIPYETGYHKALGAQIIAQSKVTSATNSAQISFNNAKSALLNAQTNLDKAMPMAALVAQRKAALDSITAALSKAGDTVAKVKDVDPLDLQIKQNGVIVAKVNVMRTKDSLDKIKVGADPVDVALKQSAVEFYADHLKTAQVTLSKLTAGPDPIQLGKLQLTLQKAQADLADGQQKLDQTTLVAPFGGIVDQILIKKGNLTVSNAVSANTTAMVLVDPSQVEVNAVVDEADINNVRPGQTVQVSLQSAPNVPLTGAVKSVAYLGKTQSGVVNYSIKISLNTAGRAVPAATAPAGEAAASRPGVLPSPGEPRVLGGMLSGTPRAGQGVASGTGVRGPASLDAASPEAQAAAIARLNTSPFRDGMTALLSIVVNQASNVVTVPVRTVSNIGGKRMVKVVQADGTLEQRTVTTGLANGTNVEVTSGLAEGEMVQLPAAGSTRTATSGATFGGIGIGGGVRGG